MNKIILIIYSSIQNEVFIKRFKELSDMTDYVKGRFDLLEIQKMENTENVFFIKQE